ncbi:MAG: PEP-CTERM sorting domain-containing protein [Gammaproteobacteria bacterium]
MTLNCRGTFTALLIVASGVSPLANAVPVSGQGTWETTLQSRDLDGNSATVEAYYDTVLNITWLANANFAQTSGFDADGLMVWATANSWATGLNINGITGWRLPTVSPVDGTTADDATFSNIGTEDEGHNISAPGTLFAGSTASELAHLFYNTLGDKSVCNPATSTTSQCISQPGSGLTNTALFANLVAGRYWSSTTYSLSTGNAWSFSTTVSSSGLQGNTDKTSGLYAWAVHPGDVAVVPAPSAVWLLGTGLVGFIGVARRRLR